jgi:hypothetical protein
MKDTRNQYERTPRVAELIRRHFTQGGGPARPTNMLHA